MRTSTAILMKRYIPTLLVILGISLNAVQAQSQVEVYKWIKKINETYASSTKYCQQMKYSVFQDITEQKPNYETMGDLVRGGDNWMVSLEGVIEFHSSGLMISVDTLMKELEVLPATGNTMSEMFPKIDSSLSKGTESLRSTVKDGVLVFYSEFDSIGNNPPEYLRIEYWVDTVTVQLKRIRMYGSRAYDLENQLVPTNKRPWIQIDYFPIQIGCTTYDAYLSTSYYYTESNGRIIPSAKFKKYSIDDHRVHESSTSKSKKTN